MDFAYNERKEMKQRQVRRGDEMADIAKKEYRNVFAELGIHQDEVETRLQEIIRFYFYGEEQERVYYGKNN